MWFPSTENVRRRFGAVEYPSQQADVVPWGTAKMNIPNLGKSYTRMSRFAAHSATVQRSYPLSSSSYVLKASR